LCKKYPLLPTYLAIESQGFRDTCLKRLYQEIDAYSTPYKNDEKMRCNEDTFLPGPPMCRCRRLKL